MRHAIMRSCKHARRAPSADAAAQSQHAGHVSALGEAQLLVERPGALVLDVHVELYLLGLGLGSDHRMRSGVCDRDAAHLADRAQRAEPGVPGHSEQRGRNPAPPEGGIDVQLAHEDDPLRLRRVRVRVLTRDWAEGHSERVGDGWRARGGVRASRGSMESYNRSKESDMDSWERFTVSL